MAVIVRAGCLLHEVRQSMYESLVLLAAVPLTFLPHFRFRKRRVRRLLRLTRLRCRSATLHVVIDRPSVIVTQSLNNATVSFPDRGPLLFSHPTFQRRLLS